MNVKKAAAIFLALMAALTFLSRAMDSFTVIRVNTGFGKQDVVLYTIQGEGELTAGRTVYISLPENMQVEEIAARPGQSVKAGDTVLTLQMEGLEEERDALSLEYKKAELALKQEQMSLASVPRVRPWLCSSWPLPREPWSWETRILRRRRRTMSRHPLSWNTIMCRKRTEPGNR